MSEWKRYQRYGETEMRPYIPGEDLEGVSVSHVDDPKEGDMIARDPNNPEDQWLVNEAYFKAHFVRVGHVGEEQDR